MAITNIIRLLIIALVFNVSGCFQNQTSSDTESSMYWIEDQSGLITFDEIREKKLSSDWNQAEGRYPNFGFTNSAIWLSLPMKNRHSVSTSMLLEIAFPLHDHVDMYILDGDELIKSYHAGDQHVFSNRPLNHRNFLFPQAVPPDSELRALVRLQSSDTMYLPVTVAESNEFYIQDQKQILLLGLFFGFLSIMLVYNLLLYFSTGHKSYLYYVFCTASIVYMQLTQKGLGFQYIWPDQILFNHLSVPIVNLLVMACSLLFIKSFLELDSKRQPKITWFFNTLIAGSVFGLVATTLMVVSNVYLIPYSVIVLITAGMGIGAAFTTIAVLTRLSLQKNRSAQILLMAWLSLLVGVFLFALGRIGAPIPMLLSENAMLIGSTLEAALISFALARHIKNEREARMQAQELALVNERKTREVQNSLIKFQERTTQELEGKVKERTQSLESAMQKLTLANQKLDNLARLDGLTGLSNRRNFDQKFDSVWNKSVENQQPLSMLMADIDFFKKINDNYGHLFGDQCLKQVAGVLKQCVNKPEYLAARFGGEEFIIMLANTEESTASAIAERIRRSIEKIQMDYEGKAIQFTISVGVATVIPAPQTMATELKETADQALYFAKDAGRNCVMTLDKAKSNCSAFVD